MKRKIAMANFVAKETKEENIVQVEKMMEEAANKGAKLICFPEVGFGKFFPQCTHDYDKYAAAEPIPGPITDRVCKKAKELNLVTVISLFEEAQLGEYYDSAVCIDADGELLGVSRMMHIFEAQNYNEKFFYAPGNTLYPVYKTAAGPVGICICYDSWFPEHFRALALRGAEIVVVPTAESYPCNFDQIETYDLSWYMDVLTAVQGKASAACNGIFVGVSNRAGYEDQMKFLGQSYVTSPWGKILGMASIEKNEVLVVEVDTEDIRQARQAWPLLRDRRPETYGMLCEAWASKVKFAPGKVEI